MSELDGPVRLEHVGIGVTGDLYPVVVRFYTEGLGWTLVREFPGQATFLTDGRSAIEIYPRDGLPLAAPHHLAMVVPPDRFAATLDRINAFGGRTEEPTGSFPGSRMAVFADPAGNSHQLVARTEPFLPG